MAILNSKSARWSVRWEDLMLHLMLHEADSGRTLLDVELTDDQAKDLIQDLSRSRANKVKQMARDRKALSEKLTREQQEREAKANGGRGLMGSPEWQASNSAATAAEEGTQDEREATDNE